MFKDFCIHLLAEVVPVVTVAELMSNYIMVSD